MTPAIVDELLVLRAQEGSSEAFDRLIERWQGAVMRHAARFVGRDTAHDVAQDAWIVVVRKLSRLDDPARFVPWLLRIVAAVAVDFVRARTRRARAESSVDPPDATNATTLDGCSRSTERDERLRAAVAALPPEQRIPVELFYVEELSVHDIAEVLGIPPGTVKSRLFQARARLRERLME